MNEQTSAINEAIENIRKSGPLTPTRLLRVAKNPNSILHDLFDWDDAKAGHQWRLEQARRFIRTRVIYEPRTNRVIHAYVNIPSPSGEGEYVPTQVVVRHPDKLALARDAALRDLRAARDNLSELDEAVRLYGQPEQGQHVAGAVAAVTEAERELASV